MPEFSNYVEGLTPAADATGTVLIPVSKDGDAVSLTPQQIADLAPPGGVTSVTGTTNRITSSGGATPVINIDAAYDAAIVAAAVAAVPKVLVVAVSDELSLLSAGTNKIRFRMPYAMTLTAVRASLTTAQPSGASIFTVDINESGSTILSTKLTIDNTEKTSTTAATAAVISDSSLADDAEMTVDIDLVGDPGATGLKITLIGL